MLWHPGTDALSPGAANHGAAGAAALGLAPRVAGLRGLWSWSSVSRLRVPMAGAVTADVPLGAACLASQCLPLPERRLCESLPR